MSNSQALHQTRRDVFKRAAALGVVAATGASGLFISSAKAAAPKFPFAKIIDLTHTLYQGFPTYSGDHWYHDHRAIKFEERNININKWDVMEHTGTHTDAPLHFTERGKSVDAIPVEDFLCPLAVVNIKAKAATDPDAFLTKEDLLAWEAKHGRLPEKSCVVMNSGWGLLLTDPRFTGKDANGKYHTPGFHPEAIEFLLKERSVNGVGVDTLSLDRGIALGQFPAHKAWLGAGRWGVECLANLDSVSPAGAWIFVGAPKVKGGTGGPSRIVAFE